MKLLWISIAVLFVLGLSLTAAEPLDILSEELRCTIRNPLGEDVGLLDIRDGVGMAIAERDPQSLAQYVLCALSDGDKVAVDFRGKSLSRARVLSSQECSSGTRGLVLTPILNCENKELAAADIEMSQKCDPEAYVESQGAENITEEVKALRRFVQKAVPTNSPSRRNLEALFRKIDNEFGVFSRKITRSDMPGAADALGRLGDHYDGIVSLAKEACREKKIN